MGGCHRQPPYCLFGLIVRRVKELRGSAARPPRGGGRKNGRQGAINECHFVEKRSFRKMKMCRCPFAAPKARAALPRDGSLHKIGSPKLTAINLRKK